MTLPSVVSVVVKFSKIIKARKERFFSCDNLTRLKKLRGRKEGTALFSGGGGGSLAGFDSILGKCESYSATTRTGALGRRLSNHNDFLKTKDSQISCKRTNEIQASPTQPLKTLKPFEPTRPLRKQPSNSCPQMLLVRLQKT